MIPMQRLVVPLLPGLAFALGGLLGWSGTFAVRSMAPEPQTLLQAVEAGRAHSIYRMISSGQDPGQAVVLDHPILYWTPGQTISPLLVEIARGNFNLVTYMVHATRDLQASPNDQALCVAARFGHRNLAELLFQANIPPAPQEGCDQAAAMPEEIASDFGNASLAKALKSYRVGAASSRTPIGPK